jgi:hypothetical protein
MRRQTEALTVTRKELHLVPSSNLDSQDPIFGHSCKSQEGLTLGTNRFPDPLLARKAPNALQLVRPIPSHVSRQGLSPYPPTLVPQRMMVEPMGFEPTTSSMPSRRAPNCATAPPKANHSVCLYSTRRCEASNRLRIAISQRRGLGQEKKRRVQRTIRSRISPLWRKLLSLARRARLRVRSI